MTKAELLEKVNALPDDVIFLVSSDEEGNSYREASLSIDELALNDGYEWNTIHPDDVDEYKDDGLVKVAVFW